MSATVVLSVALGLALAGLVAVIVLSRASSRRAIDSARAEMARAREEAKREAEAVRQRALLEAREKVAAERARTEREISARRDELHAEELRLEQTARDLDHRDAEISSRSTEISSRESALAAAESAAAAARAAAELLVDQQNRRLEQIAGMTQDEARAELARRVEEGVRRQMAGFVKRAREEAEEEAERNARAIVAQAIHRSSTRSVVETTVTPVTLPSDEMKGRIIGREGRNIRAIETATGVDVIIDDTPNTLLLSSFDPMRREIAKIAIDRLIEDGRVHPARIEEVSAKVREEFEAVTAESGEAAAIELGLAEIHPRLHRLLGRLKYRSWRGHNLLNHSIETALIAAYMAAEMGARIEIAKRAGLLHEVSQTEEPPALVPAVLASAEIVAKFGESEEVVHAIQAIHPRSEPRSIEGLLVSAANRISEMRPGARKDNMDVFVTRLRQLEQIAASFEGVKQAFAVRAGKELRVMVEAEKVTDERVLFLSREIASRIEQELDYPGQIRVSVIREIRAVDFAV